MQSDRPTRVRVLDRLKEEGPQPVRTLSAALAVTPMAIRQHLLALERDGLVRRSTRRRPVGRPESVYSLTVQARGCFPDHHESLACELLEDVRDGLGAEALAALLESRLVRQLERYRERIRGTTLAARLKELAALQDEHGFMTACDLERGELVQRNCSVCAAAERFPQLCELELRLFEGLLGTPMERVEHALGGGAACRYRAVGPGSETASTGGRPGGAHAGRTEVPDAPPGARLGGREESR